MNLLLDNYRSFRNEDLSFSKINILIGENSSGKSSVLKFFLALKQSLVGTQNRSNINLALTGDYVDLGNYSEMIHLHDVDKELTFVFTFLDEYPKFFEKFFESLKKMENKSSNSAFKIVSDISHKLIGSATKLSITINRELKTHSTIKTEISNPQIGKLIIKHNNGDKTLEKILGDSPDCQLIFMPTGKEEIIFDGVEFDKISFLSMIKFNSFFEKMGKSFSIDFFKVAFLLLTQNFLESFLENIHFINPINSVPKRFYLKRDLSNDYVNLDLDQFVNIFSNNDENLDETSGLLARINESIRFLGIADEIKINKNDEIPIAELKVRIDNIWNNITDVGYGLSLQLPILFQSIISNNKEFGENIFIEQPEVHLHPRLQAQLMETLIKFGNKNNYFIETHSEHIVRKLQIIAKKQLYGIKASDISILYFTRENNITTVKRHIINEMGKLVPSLPSGFFDSSYTLAKELL